MDGRHTRHCAADDVLIMAKGRPRLEREREKMKARLATIEAGLLACYEIIAEFTPERDELRQKLKTPP